MHQKHPVSRFSFQTNWMKNKKLEKWFVKTFKTIFLLVTFILVSSLKSLRVFLKESTFEGMYLQVILHL